MKFLTPLIPLVAALVLAGCANVATPEPHALPATPVAFKGPQAQAAAVQAQWWKTFGDAQLDALTEQALAHNTQIEQAAARLNESRALLRAAGSEQWPQLGLNGGAGRQTGQAARSQNVYGNLYTANASLSYEVDLIGRISDAKKAAALDARQSDALLQGTRLLVQAQVAQTYFALRALEAEQVLVRETVAAYRETLSLTERRYSGGDVSELDVARVRTEVSATESAAIDLDRRRAELEHALAVLTGAPASNFAVGAGAWGEVLPLVPAGVPSEVLTRRPDVVAAQAGWQAAQKRVDVAQKAWFPSFSLTAAAGGSSPELSSLFKTAGGLFGVQALASLPIFDGGRRVAGVESAAAHADGASAAYRERILVAFQDVEDQLSALQLLGQQAGVQQQAVASAVRATQLSDSRYRNGLVSQLELLDARRSELALRREALQIRAAQYQATVSLIKALGGGWA
ncbi:MAG TPA: efflux transporter outer membrane subunit [Burkholderiaceae bacterium]|jgi:multidrug efflux system outer membrane protein